MVGTNNYVYFDSPSNTFKISTDNLGFKKIPIINIDCMTCAPFISNYLNPAILAWVETTIIGPNIS